MKTKNNSGVEYNAPAPVQKGRFNGQKLVRRVRVLEPFRPGENHFLYELWEGEDGKFYVTSQHGRPFPNGPLPTEVIAWDSRTIIGGPFSSPEEAESWFWGE